MSTLLLDALRGLAIVYAGESGDYYPMQLKMPQPLFDRLVKECLSLRAEGKKESELKVNMVLVNGIEVSPIKFDS